MLEELRTSPLASPQFWKDLDLTKKRDDSNRKYLSRRGGHNRIPLEDRNDVLRGDRTLASIAARLREGRSKRVVVLIGAGASTAAGIPDFRSSSGLWSTSDTRKLFSMEGFSAQPERFWKESASLFVNRSPTKVHRFLAALHRRGKLLRVYTQNIDGLETEAGVPPELVIDCHGSARRVVCSADARHRTGVESVEAVIASVQAGAAAPRCATCGALLRPDIVFFGEPMPGTFMAQSGKDLEGADLLIVIGTTLTVYQ